jgi:hypothetical protein
MDNVVSLKGCVTFNSNINNRGIFAKCAIGYSNYNNDAFERGSLIFLTNNNANTNNINMQSDIRMSINSDGNVGIGTATNINEKLVVNGNIIANTLSAVNLSGAGSNITNINTSNISDGILPIGRGGTGINTLGINQILAGNRTGDRIINSGVGLTWNTNTNTLFASNISGIGSNITNINTCNITDGILSVIRGGIGTNSLGINQLLIGGSTSITSTSNLVWNNNILTATNINATNINATLLNGCNINSNFSKWTSSGSHIFFNNSNGNVIIGSSNTSTPYKLTVTGSIAASQDIVEYYSDERLKQITNYVNDVLPNLSKINVFKYNCNDLAVSFGFDKSKNEIGFSAQEIQKYYPELVTLAPFDTIRNEETNKISSKSGEDYLTLKYDRFAPVLLQAIKELNNKYNALEDKHNILEDKHRILEEKYNKLEYIINNNII